MTTGYFVGSTTPDESVYNFWIQTDGGGSPLSLRTYYSGAWVDVYATTIASYLTTAAAAATYQTIAGMSAYLTTAAAAATYQTIAGMSSYLTTASAAATYQTIAGMSSYLTTASASSTYQTQAAMSSYSTTSQMNTAIETQTKYEFRAYKSSAPQNYTAGTGEAQITLDAENYDTNSAFASNVFTAPVAGRYHFAAAAFIAVSTGTPTGVERTLILRKNGSAYSWWKEQSTDDTDGLTMAVSDTIDLAANDTVDIAVQVVSTGASTWDITNTTLDTYLSGFMVRKA